MNSLFVLTYGHNDIPLFSLVLKYPAHCFLAKMPCRWLNRIPNSIHFSIAAILAQATVKAELRPRFQAYMNPNGRCFSFDQAMVAVTMETRNK